LGGIHVQLDPMYAESEIEFVLNDSGTRYMVVQEELYQRVKKVQERTSLRKIIVVRSGKRQLELDAADHYFDDLLIPSTEAPEIPINRETDIALMEYSRGKPKSSKGIMLTHLNLLENMIQYYHASLIGGDPAPDNLEIMNVLAVFQVCESEQGAYPMAKKEVIVNRKR
jgi:long-chain acyl-CoA synthetase